MSNRTCCDDTCCATESPPARPVEADRGPARTMQRTENGVQYFPSAALGLRPDGPGSAFWAVALDRVMLTYFEVQPNARFERHSHDAEQITTVLDGALVFEWDGSPAVSVRAGETIAIPSGVPHAVSAGTAGARAIDAWSPPHAKYAPGTVTPADSPPDAIRDTVRSAYATIARGGACGPSGGGCCGATPLSPGELAGAIGYTAGDLAATPDSANMGLSCGNPTALASLRPGEVVLDLGSGGGFDCFVAGPKVGAAGRVIGVDMTPDMLGKARRGLAWYRGHSGLDNVEFRLGEIENLPVADASVDVVISNCVLNLSPDKGRVWREIARVLKPGGRVAVSDLALLRPLPESIRRDVEALVGCIAGAVLVEQTRAMALAAGLSDVVLTPKPGYMDAMTTWQDPLYQRILGNLPAGTKPADYITSLDVSARKAR